jgi:hypothetical protein
MRVYSPIAPPFWAREFPIGWRDVDKGVGDLNAVEKPAEKALKKPAPEEPKEAEQHKVKMVQEKPAEKKTTKDKPVEKVTEKAGEKSLKKVKKTFSKGEPKEAEQHKVAGLSCKAYGGPSDEDAAEMVYWQDIPVDASFVSPFKSKEKQYLTFEPGTFVI